MAVVGSSYADLSGKEFAIGESSFEKQGRALVMSKNVGLLRIYGECETGKLLGAEMMGPSVEHMAHLLAWAIQKQMTAYEALKMPVYHPVVEEGLRTALRDLAGKISKMAPPMEIALCDCSAVEGTN